ncbi:MULTISPECIES: ATP-binding cassette domain-containing protein [unclassified Achromobacter]|uniref:ATP-binding cassette domain-containing protein n=1 Tax=unclassified Achromobacter TaxID=2626865 RepID=UPI000B5162E6|nr:MULTISPECIES: ATP-binding cassette domain-containing protein [unclassified Achromobacter]OWT74549.1 ABC transporter [Achromobacter sp. HZ34]OWT79016.1 ABC transporter [Achromobacter sp. HZ28]
MTDHVLDVQDLVFHRKDQLVLDRVSLAVERGKIVGLLGANGAGKTTLFDVICGLRRQEAGSIRGVPVHRIAYLTQVITVPDALQLGELARLVYGLAAPGRIPTKGTLDQCKPKIRKKFERLWHRRAHACSYGEKRWFILMVILAIDADLYILDEPTAGVDPEYRFYIWEALSQLREKDKSVLFATHLVTEVERHADAFYFLKEGTLRRFDDAASLMQECGAESLEEAFVNYVTR